eukprot:GEMP01001173.1.p1 GENE.GEMP01001173.1~~GEMP01001173.1.p1  ORF type:complete len:885 (+),score=198.97 GEMP01001173.1:238-2892(+)
MGQQVSGQREPTVLGGNLNANFQFMPGRLEDRYDVPRVGKLGEGTFGTVWRGKDRRTQEYRAVKTLEKGRMQTLRLRRDEVLIEVELLRKCYHKNIVQSFEAFENARQFHFVLEYCDGGDLQNRVMDAPNGSISEDTVAQWMRQILEAIAYLHVDARNICHRDIKPHNFMFHGEVLKLGDFGIAIQPTRLLREKIGSPAFMAPEIHLLPNRSSGYDNKVDIWAAGVVMVFLLSAHCPFIDAHGRLLKDEIIEGRVPLWEDEKFFGLFRALGMEEGPSRQARVLVRLLLKPERLKRITAADAVSHAWFVAQENGTLYPVGEAMPLLSLDDFENSAVGNLMNMARGMAEEGLQQAQRGLKKLHTKFEEFPVQESLQQAADGLRSQIEKLPVPVWEAPTNLKDCEEALSACCVCYNDTKEFDYVCKRCKHVVCYQCLPRLHALECPHCRLPAQSMRAERSLIRMYNAGLDIQKEISKTIAKAEETKLPKVELQTRFNPERLEACILCNRPSTMFDFACPKCAVCICAPCTTGTNEPVHWQSDRKVAQHSEAFGETEATTAGAAKSSSSDASPSSENTRNDSAVPRPPTMTMSTLSASPSAHASMSTGLGVDHNNTFVTPLSSPKPMSCSSTYVDTKEDNGKDSDLVDISLGDSSPSCVPESPLVALAPMPETVNFHISSSSTCRVAPEVRNNSVGTIPGSLLTSCPYCTNTVEFCAALDNFRSARMLASSTQEVIAQWRDDITHADYSGMVADLGKDMRNDFADAKDAVATAVAGTTASIKENIQNLREARVAVASSSQSCIQNKADELDKCTKCNAASEDTDFACPRCSAVICSLCSRSELDKCVKCQNEYMYASALSRHHVTMETWANVRTAFTGFTTKLTGFFE